MPEGIYVVVAERDTYEPSERSRPIVFEQFADKASFRDAKQREGNIGSKYGKTRIARLVFVDQPQPPQAKHGLDRFWFVWNPQGASPSRRHDSRESAEREASRLANLNPGLEIVVLESICSCAAKPAEFTPHVVIEDIPF
jgi:chloramphenicol 3-O-phosphotransferase